MNTVFCILFFLGTPGSDTRQLGALDQVPAATLLLPYFEVALNHSGHTLFTVANLSSSATFAHMTMYTNAGVGTFSYSIPLSAHDIEAIDLDELFFDGILGSQGVVLPASGSGSSHDLQMAHTGQFTSGGFLKAFDTGNLNKAVGYILIDVVNSDLGTNLFQDTAGYFNTMATKDNILTGEWRFLSDANGSSYGESMVHLEAGNLDGQLTFYAKYVSQDGSDGREPLPDTWGVPYQINFPTGSGSTNIYYWRETKVIQQPFTIFPSWAPLREEYIVAFSESEDAVELTSTTLFFPAACGEIYHTALGAIPFSKGGLYVGLDHDTGLPTSPAGGYLFFYREENGLHSIAHDAVVLPHLDLGH